MYANEIRVIKKSRKKKTGGRQNSSRGKTPDNSFEVDIDQNARGI